MANPKTYIGVGGKARRVKSIYVGVNGVARRVKRVYIGVNNVAKLVYFTDWYTANGTIALSNVLAAYKFKGASSASEARTDLTGHGYTLSGGSWDASNGMSGSLTNGNLPNAGVVTQILFIGSYGFSGNGTVQTKDLLTRMKFPYLTTNCRFGYTAHASSSGTVHYNGTQNRFGLITDWYDGQNNGYFNKSTCKQSDAAGSNCVIAGSTAGTVWVNGSSRSMSTVTTTGWDGSNKYIANSNVVVNGQVCRVYAAAFYKVALSNQQHADIASALNGGLY